jgi:hypothetical protein
VPNTLDNKEGWAGAVGAGGGVSATAGAGGSGAGAAGGLGAGAGAEATTTAGAYFVAESAAAPFGQKCPIANVSNAPSPVNSKIPKMTTRLSQRAFILD